MSENFGPIRHDLEAAWKRRQIYVESHGIGAYRLCTQEELKMPLGVDIYSGRELGEMAGPMDMAPVRDGIDETVKSAVLQIYDEYIDRDALEEVKRILREDFRVQEFFEKRRYRVKESPEGGGDLREPPVERVVTEYGHQFVVNLNNYLDTGLFLDHRETRRMVEKMVADQVKLADGQEVSVLNLFAYTGSFSVYAAAGGAAMTHTVDLSKTYCDWARRNLALNGFPEDKNWVYRMDTFEFYRYAARKGLSFDLIIIDPPTFSRNKDSNFSVQRDQVKLIEGAASLLRDGGRILFSNNCLDFQLDQSLEQQFNIRNIQNETVPMDFWLDTIQSDWWKGQNQIHNCFLLEKLNN